MSTAPLLCASDAHSASLASFYLSQHTEDSSQLSPLSSRLADAHAGTLQQVQALLESGRWGDGGFDTFFDTLVDALDVD